jgi:hypothetical protein
MAMFHLVSILFCQVLAGQNTWTQKTNYPGGAIYFGSSFLINGKLMSQLTHRKNFLHHS